MRQHDLTVHYAHPLQLTLHPKNARKGVVPEIKKSLLRYGQYRPLVVSKKTNYVLAGNHTLKAALELNLDEVAYVVVDVDEDTEARIMLADNRLSDLGDYDSVPLVDLLQGLDGDYEGTGYDAGYLDKLLSDFTDEADEGPEFEQEYKLVKYGVIIDCASRSEEVVILARLADIGINGKAMS